MPRIHNTDLILCEVQDLTSEDPDAKCRRLVHFNTWFNEDGDPDGIGCYHCDADTGEDVVSFPVGGNLQVNAEGPLWVPTDTPKTSSDGKGQILLTDYYTTCLVGISQDGGGTSWTTADIPEEDVGNFCLLQWAGGIVYGIGEWTDYETITDNRLVTSNDELWGTPYTEDRTEAARGHSYHQGLVAISIEGVYLGRADHGGETIPAGQLEGTKTDSIYSDEFSYTIPRGNVTIFGGDIVEGPIANLLAQFSVPNYTEYFYKVGVYSAEDHGPDNNPYLSESFLTPGTADEVGYNEDDGAAAGYRDEFNAIRDDFIAYQASFVDAAADARTQGHERLRGQRVAVNVPQHTLRSTAVDGDGFFIPTYMDLSYLSMRGPEQPQIEDPEPRMGEFWSPGRLDVNSTRRFPVWPSVPRDQSLAGQNIGGTQYRWAYFNEYMSYIGAEDLGPFEGLWSIEGGEEYTGTFSFTGACGPDAEGELVTIEQSIVWEGESEEQFDKERTLDILCFSNCYDGKGTLLGPTGGEVLDVELEELVPRALVWQYWKGLVKLWEYNYSNSGEVCVAYAPIPLNVKADPEDEEAQILFFTFVQIGSEFKCVILNKLGDLIDDPEVPEGLSAGCFFNGKEFRSNEGSVKWTPVIGSGS